MLNYGLQWSLWYYYYKQCIIHDEGMVNWSRDPWKSCDRRHIAEKPVVVAAPLMYFCPIVIKKMAGWRGVPKLSLVLSCSTSVHKDWWLLPRCPLREGQCVLHTYTHYDSGVKKVMVSWELSMWTPAVPVPWAGVVHVNKFMVRSKWDEPINIQKTQSPAYWIGIDTSVQIHTVCVDIKGCVHSLSILGYTVHTQVHNLQKLISPVCLCVCQVNTVYMYISS